jgi:hypothetical protein
MFHFMREIIRSQQQYLAPLVRSPVMHLEILCSIRSVGDIFLTLWSFLLHVHRRASAHFPAKSFAPRIQQLGSLRRSSRPGPAQFSVPSPFLLSVLHTMVKSISFEPYFQMQSIVYEIDQKNARNLSMPSIHLFASRLMSFDDSYPCSPHIYA